MGQPQLNEEALLELSNNLRTLALRLVRDEPIAEDIVQEAWLAALRTPGRAVKDARRWLRGVVRHLAARHVRAEVSRREHEPRAARPEWDDSQADVIERMSTARLVVRAVDALDEPQRRVLRMRFLEERGLDEVAAELGRPTETIRTWTKRGIAQLRTELDRRSKGDRAVWAAALWRLGGEDARHTVALPAAGAARAVWSSLAAASVVAILGALAWWFVPGAEDSRAGAAAGGVELAVSDDVSVVSEEAGALGSPRTREALTAPASPPSAAAANELAPLPACNITAFVVDADGRPVRAATVRAFAGREPDREAPLFVGETDAQGELRFACDPAQLRAPSFGFPGPGGWLRLVAAIDGAAASDHYHLRLEAGDEVECLLTLGGGEFTVSGKLMDERGQPVVGASVTVLPPTSGIRSDDLGALVHPFTARTWTGEDGAFGFEHLPRRLLHVELIAEGFGPARAYFQPKAGFVHMNQSWTMLRGTEITGRLRLPDGSPAVGARVFLDYGSKFPGRRTETRADEHGEYVLPAVPPAPWCVFAVADGDASLWARTSLIVERGGARWDAQLASMPGVRVSIEAEDGRPAAGHLVVLGVAAGEGVPWMAEQLADAAGRAHFPHVPDERLTMWVRAPDHVQTGVASALRVPGIRPGLEEQRFSIPPAPPEGDGVLRAVLLAPNGGVPMGAHFMVRHREFDLERRGDLHPTTGTVEIGGLPAGEYDLCVVQPGRGVLDLGLDELAEHGQLDLGLIQLPPTTPVVLSATEGSPPDVRRVQLFGTVDGRVDSNFAGLGLIDLKAPVPLELMPGEYAVRHESSTGTHDQFFVVEEGEALTLELELGEKE